ncbi:hypothetical protein HYU13_05035 [Candidatus Woesearchaeota archaeon]|nr:hypothetical protein [Candidatus Woesearchaeota archaeon]
MYSKQNLRAITDYVKRPIGPDQATRPEDLKRFPLQILVSYYLADKPLSREELAERLRHMGDFNRELQPYRPKPGNPSPPQGISLDEGLNAVCADIRARTGKFATTYGERLIIADKTPGVYRFPSGEKLAYFELTNEVPANVPILDGAYFLSDPTEFFIRRNHVNFMLALLGVEKDKPELAPYQGAFDSFEDGLTALLLCHELSELKMLKAGMMPGTIEHREQASEFFARELMSTQGGDEAHFKLYHLLAKTDNPESAGNLSSSIVGANFNPLF